MGKPSPNKQKRRRKKRAKKEQHSAKYRATKEAFAKFPEIVYEVNDAPRRLVDAVKQTMHDIVANHERLLDAWIVPASHIPSRQQELW